MLLVAPNQGEVERLANLLREYELPYRLGSRIQHAGSENIYDESSYLAGDLPHADSRAQLPCRWRKPARCEPRPLRRE